MLMQHLLCLFLLVVAPIWDLYDTRKLKRNPSSEQKIRYYKTIAPGSGLPVRSQLLPLASASCSPSVLRPVKSPGYYGTLGFATW